MKISLNWLRDYLDTNIKNKQICSFLTDIGLEVSELFNLKYLPESLNKIVVGKIENCYNHPNANKLKITEVNIGKTKNLQIICGAPNVDKNQYVFVAQIGSNINIENKKIKVKKVKLRGITSEGMICSEQELNISDNHHGIMVLSKKYKPGTSATEIINIDNDQIAEIDLTPNRNDAMSHIGVAKDLYAKLKWEKRKCKINLPKEIAKNGTKKDKIKIDIKEPQLCPRYSGITIKNVKIQESPIWLKNKLNSIGVKTINNIVDITNFILHETGHPLHAFDLDKIKGQKIIIQKAKNNTIFKTLDNIDRKLHKEDLMICNSTEPMCIAGIIGGDNSMVNRKTKNIFIESAYFNPIQIRKSAKRHNINSDSSFRFERGCDPNQTIKNLLRAITLIKQIDKNVKLEYDIIDVYPKKIKPNKINVYYENINKTLGIEIDKKDINHILISLEINILKKDKEKITIEIPTNKSDLYREIDIIEEIARIYGYNNINSDKNPAICFPKKNYSDNREYNKIATFLSNNGFFEVINNSLINSNLNQDSKSKIEMLNPLSLEMDALRENLIYGLLNNISYNLNRKQEIIKIFEFGNIYYKINNKTKSKDILSKYIEKNKMAFMICGLEKNTSWHNNKNINFFWIKNITDQIMDKCYIDNINLKEFENNIYEYGIEYIYKNECVAKTGKIKETVLKNFKIKKDVFFTEVNWDLIKDNILKKQIIFNKQSKYPEVKRDLSIIINNEINFQLIQNCILNMNIKTIKGVNLIDVFKGNDSTNNKKSYTISITLEDQNKTLIEKDIQTLMKNVLLELKNKLNVEIRI